MHQVSITAHSLQSMQGPSMHDLADSLSHTCQGSQGSCSYSDWSSGSGQSLVPRSDGETVCPVFNQLPEGEGLASAPPFLRLT
jgi:hypothetical protein